MPESDVDAPETAPESVVELPEGEESVDPQAERQPDRQERRDAGYRSERDAARAERDALASRVAGLQRAEVVRRAAEHLHTPADLDLIVTAEEYAACYDSETGALDEGVMAALFDRIATERPSWRKGRAGYVPDLGFKPSAGRGGLSAQEAFHTKLQTRGSGRVTRVAVPTPSTSPTEAYPKGVVPKKKA